MHAVAIEDGRLRWAERADPVPGTTELLVAVEAAGLNAADLLQLAGRYPPPPGAPADVPGLECAGVVAAVGAGVTRFAPGDRVMGLLGGGGQAELAILHERVAVPVPAGCSAEQAGGFCEAFATAHDALFSQGGLGMGERLLVTGAAGGVGTAAVQLGVAAGAQVAASVRDPGLREAVAAFGAEVVEPGAVARHGPYDLVLELVSGPGFAESFSSLATAGRLVVIGVGAGARVELSLGELMAGRQTLRGSTLRARTLEEKATVLRALERHVLPLLAAGRLRVPVAQRFELADAADAYARFASGGKLGKIVLVAHSSVT